MSDEHLVHQLIVPAYVWHDEQQRKAALVKIGTVMAQTSVRARQNVDLDSAVVVPHGLQAVVAHAPLDGEPVAFVGYEQCDVEHADLVMIVVDAKVTAA